MILRRWMPQVLFGEVERVAEKQCLISALTRIKEIESFHDNSYQNQISKILWKLL